MSSVYLGMAAVLALMLAFSALGKIRRDPRQVKVIHETLGVPFKYFPLLAVCEFAGAFGLVAGIWWPALGVAAAIGVVLYFVAAVVFHLRVHDIKGIGPAVFLLVLAAVALAVRLRTM